MADENKYDLTEEQMLQKLLAADEVPTRRVGIERIGIPVTLKGLTGKQVFTIRERCTTTTTKKNVGISKLDEEAFNVQLIAAATVSPNWNNPALLTKYQASTGEEVIKRVLLAGELSQLGDITLDLSGFNTDLQEVKN